MEKIKFTSDGTEVSIYNLLAYLCKKFIVFAICLILGILIFFGLRGVNSKSSYRISLSYKIVLKREKNKNATLIRNDYLYLKYLINTDTVVSNLIKESYSQKSSPKISDIVSFQYDGVQHLINISINTSDKKEAIKLVPQIKSDVLQTRYALTNIKSLNLISENHTPIKNTIINKKVLILSICPFLLAFIYYIFKYIKMNPLLSKENLKRIFPEVECVEYNLDKGFTNNIFDLRKKMQKNEFINLEVLDFDNDKEIFKENLEMIQNISKSYIIFEVDSTIQGVNEVNEKLLENKFIKVNFDTFKSFLKSNEYKNLRNKNQEVLLISTNDNNQVGYQASKLTNNTIVILGTKEKKDNIRDLINSNVENISHLRSIILYPNYINRMV